MGDVFGEQDLSHPLSFYCCHISLNECVTVFGVYSFFLSLTFIQTKEREREQRLNEAS